jgi:hypothetical protein
MTIYMGISAVFGVCLGVVLVVVGSAGAIWADRADARRRQNKY